MKSKIVASCLYLLIIVSPSCKKDSFPDIVGQWVSDAVYIKQENGTFNWVEGPRFSEHFNFYPDSRFAYMSDVPGGHGTYSYNNGTKDLLLNYEADPYGNIPQTVTYKVEKLNNDKLIIAYYSAAGSLFAKTEYSRVN